MDKDPTTLGNFHSNSDVMAQALHNKEILIELGQQNSKFALEAYKQSNV